MKIFLLASLLSLVGCAPDTQHEPLTVVRLEIPDGICSGTVVTPSVILSAGHCFGDVREEDQGKEAKKEPPTSMKINGRTVKILAVVLDGNDHALVHVDFVFPYVAHLGRKPRTGAHVHYYGNPAGLDLIYREGYVASYRHSAMMLNINGFFGDSGAGIFDEFGEVIGVMNFINPHESRGLVFSLMGVDALEFTPQQYMMMGL